MNQSARTIHYPAKYWWMPGLLVALLLVLIVLLPLFVMVKDVTTAAIRDALSNSYILYIVKFTFMQASLSTLLSVGLAIPLSLALYRRQRFFARDWLLRLFSASFVMPTIIAVFGLLAVFGHAGWLNQGLALLGVGKPMSIYGLPGILLAHVFFNLPLATRVFLQLLERLPDSYHRNAVQLGLQGWWRFRVVEWPAIRGQIVGVVLVVFSLCFTSFAIVMTMGGGPKSSTIEVAIYQALRFDFDLDAAVALACIQLLCCGGFIALSTRFPLEKETRHAQAVIIQPDFIDSNRLKALDSIMISVAFLFVLLPLLSLFFKAWSPELLIVIADTHTQSALINTVMVSLGSAVVAVLMCIGLLLTARHARYRLGYRAIAQLSESSALAVLIIPPVVLGTGLFILLRQLTNVFSLSIWVVLLVNAITSLPFVIRVLSQPMHAMVVQYDRIALSLGVLGVARWRLLEWPLLRKPIGLAFALAATLSAGDLTVVALFGSPQFQTLPLLLYQRMGSYRFAEASATAFILLVVCGCLFYVLERVIGGRAAASSHREGTDVRG